MTREAFLKLSLEDREHFINSGETFSVEGSDEKGLSTSQPVIVEQPQVPPSPIAPMSQEEPSAPLYDNHEWRDGFPFADPLELLYLLDESISSGRVTLHDWQYQFLTDFAKGGIDDTKPFQALVRAANGSGKDKFIIAPCVVWLSMKFKKTISPVTSSSGAQLDKQTCRYITQLCQAVNRVFKTEIWECTNRRYICIFDKADRGQDSYIYCFATDESGKAEGYHPTDFGCKMGIFVSEDKTVTDEINTALNKCTGYTHRVHVSTPGLPMGHFYDYCATAVKRKSIKTITEVKATDWIEYHVTAHACSNISRSYIEQMKRDLPGGEFGSAYRSQVLAEFGTTDEETVIPYNHIWTLRRMKVAHLAQNHNTGGLDLSRGGDETVLSVRNGNRLLALISFKFDNTEDTVEFLVEKFNEYHLTGEDAKVWADSGGLGAPVIDRLRGLGWVNVKYVNNQSSAHDQRIYKNRGAEMWGRFGKLCERHEVMLVEDAILDRQLATRYWKKVQGNKHQLESKQQARAAGHPSPDRADSVVLCFSDYQSIGYSEAPEQVKAPFKQAEQRVIAPPTSLKALAKSEDRGYKKPIFQKDLDSLRESIAEHNDRVRSTMKN